MVNLNNFGIAAWNMRGYNGRIDYVRELLDENDIVILSEHCMYDCELNKLCLISPNINYEAKASNDLDPSRYRDVIGHCGIAIIWKQEISSYIKTVHVDSDRICAIEICTPNNSHVFVIGVYLPYATCKIANFEEQIDILEELVERCKTQGDIVIIGDFNTHIGYNTNNSWVRAWGINSPNAEKLYMFIKRNGLECVDMNSTTHGPNYTFTSASGNVTYIDHCLISKSLSTVLKECTVHEESITNTSDHLSLAIKLDLPEIIREQYCKTQASIIWDKINEQIIKTKYTDQMDNNLKEKFCEITDANVNTAVIDYYLDYIIDLMTDLSAGLISYKKRKRCHLKPYWSKELSMLAQLKKTTRNDWINADKPRDANRKIWMEYKNAKREFKKNTTCSD